MSDDIAMELQITLSSDVQCFNNNNNNIYLEKIWKSTPKICFVFKINCFYGVSVSIIIKGTFFKSYWFCATFCRLVAHYRQGH